MKNSFDQIPQSFISKWQGIADLLAKIIGVPAALIMKVENEYMEVFISSKSDNNPYHVGDKEHWNGLYCETVIKSQYKLKVPNALKDEKWDKNPDIKLGMVSYFGFPLNFPDGEPFGTICVLDRKENTYSEEYDQLLMQFKSVVELDLAMIQSLKITQDISENELVDRLLLQNKALIKSEERFRSLAEIAADSIILFEGEKLVFASHRFCEYVGIEPENIDKLTVSEVLSHIHPDDIMHYGREMQEALAQQKKQYTILFRMLNPEGKYEWLQNNTTATYDSSGKVLHRIVQARDITKQVELENELRKLIAERKQAEEAARKLSITDELTGLYNRRGFLTLAIQQLKMADRMKNGMHIFFADLDKMKWINDTLGHEKGDQALIETATILKDTFRKSDIIARMGGDEFAVLAIDGADVKPEILTQRLQNRIESYNNLENREYVLSISIGCAYYDPAVPCSIDELMTHADKRMYENKKNKKSIS